MVTARKPVSELEIEKTAMAMSFAERWTPDELPRGFIPGSKPFDFEYYERNRDRLRADARHFHNMYEGLLNAALDRKL